MRMLTPTLVAALAACTGSADNGPFEGKTYRITIQEAAYRAATTGDSDTGEEDEDDGAEDLSEDELEACGDLYDGSHDIVRVAGNQQVVTLTPTDVLAVKVTGNRNQVSVTLEEVDAKTGTKTGATGTTGSTGDSGADEPDFAGLCFLLAGNQARATVANVDARLGTFAYLGRGNQPEAVLDIQKAASVDDFRVDLAGNGGKLVITGDGDYTCPTGSIAGNAAGIECTK